MLEAFRSAMSQIMMRTVFPWRQQGRVLLLLAAGGLAEAAPPAVEPRLTAPLVDLAPYAYFDRRCQARGIVIEQLQRLARRAGLEIRFVPMPANQPRDRFEQSGVNITVALDGGWTTQEWIRQPFDLVGDLVVISKPGAPTAAEGPLRVGARRQEITDALFDTPVEPVVDPDPRRLAAQFAEGRVDRLAGVRPLLLFYLFLEGTKPYDLRIELDVQNSLTARLYLHPDLDASHGAALRAAAESIPWTTSLNQLYESYLNRAPSLAPGRYEVCAAQSRD
jgi:hypothetical protein